VTGRRARAIAVLVCALGAAPALGYLLPVTGILRRLASRREELALHAFEVRGTFAMSGEPARAAAAAIGLPLIGSELTLPALLLVKTPGRCRLELAPSGLAVSDRPAAVSRQGRLVGSKALDRVPAAAALVRGVCALLGERSGGAGPDRAWGQALARVGVPLRDVYLGRLSGRIAYVLGARPSEAKPQAWVDKQSFQPLRLIAPLAGASLTDIRLLDYGSPTGGDGFPRAVEVWEGKELRARFTTEKLAANPKIPDSVF
jgi:hypothetical protein